MVNYILLEEFLELTTASECGIVIGQDKLLKPMFGKNGTELGKVLADDAKDTMPTSCHFECRPTMTFLKHWTCVVNVETLSYGCWPLPRVERCRRLLIFLAIGTCPNVVLKARINPISE